MTSITIWTDMQGLIQCKPVIKSIGLVAFSDYFRRITEIDFLQPHAHTKSAIYVIIIKLLSVPHQFLPFFIQSQSLLSVILEKLNLSN